MKKFIIGMVTGAMLATAGTTFAATSMIGQKVDSQYNVNLNGSSIGQAIVIDGTSYLPVRKVADSLNIDVGFQNNQISLETLKNMSGETSLNVNLPTKIKDELLAKGFDFTVMDDASKVSVIKSELNQVNKDIQTLQGTIEAQNKLIERNKASIEMYKQGLPQTQDYIDGYEKQISASEQKIADCQAKLTGLQEKKVDLENILKQMEGA